MSETLAAPAAFEQDIRKSRFLAHAAPAESPDAALAFLARVAARDATHNCWAYRIGQQYRFNDDGEPAGTAGKPILAAIDGQGLDQVIAVVTRWYGGTKLGAGGLVRAYGGTAAECLRRGERRTLVEWIELELRCGFEHVGAVHAVLSQHGAMKEDEVFESDGVRLRLRVPAQADAALRGALQDATRGRIRFSPVPEAER
jgi:uncharacterized YigZ family protein